MAENPVSRTWVQQVFLPLVPGVDSLLEPLQDQAEDAQVLQAGRVTISDLPCGACVFRQESDGAPQTGSRLQREISRHQSA